MIQEGEPVLIDFGLAQLSDDMTLTQTGWLLGTPGYLAPEILYGDGPTPAADVHAWAATVTFAAHRPRALRHRAAMAIMDRADEASPTSTACPRSWSTSSRRACAPTRRTGRPHASLSNGWTPEW